MTVISESRVKPRRSSSAAAYIVRDGVVRLSSKPETDVTPRPATSRRTSLRAPSQPESTALVAEFIKSFKELEQYKYACLGSFHAPPITPPPHSS